MQKDGKWILIGIVVLALFFYGGELFSVVPVDTTTFISYTDPPRYGSECEIPSWYSNNGLISSKNSVIQTVLSKFEFKLQTYKIKTLYECKTAPSGNDVTPTYIDENDCQHWSYTIPATSRRECVRNYYHELAGYSCTWLGGNEWDCCRAVTVSAVPVSDYGGRISVGSVDGCFYTYETYKDGILIDKETDLQGIKVERSYGDDGVIYGNDLPLGVSGIEANFGDDRFYTPSCGVFPCQVMTSYRLYSPIDVLVNLSTPKSSYIEGEDVKVDTKLTNNLNIDLLSTLNIKYEVPTILGTKEQIDTYDINLPIGETNTQYTIPTSTQADRLDITPSLNIYLPTSLSSGINVLTGFEEFGIDRGQIHAYPKIKILTITEDTKSVEIIDSELAEVTEQLNLTEGELDLLNASLQEKLSLIEQYSGDLDKQTALLNNLQLSLDEKIIIVQSLTSELEEQATLAAGLKLNLDEKIILVNKLTQDIESQATLIQALTSESDEQAIIINSLNLDIESQAQMINELTSNLQYKAYLVEQLQATNLYQARLISAMELSFADQAEIIGRLDNTIQEDAVIIINLNLNLESQGLLINELRLSNTEKAELINELNLNLADQVVLINNLNLRISDDAELIKNLNLSLIEEAQLISLYSNELEIQAELIADLGLSLSEEQLIVNELTSIIEEQIALLDLIQSKKQFNIIDFWEDYQIVILIIGGLLSLLLIGGKKR